MMCLAKELESFQLTKFEVAVLLSEIKAFKEECMQMLTGSIIIPFE